MLTRSRFFSFKRFPVLAGSLTALVLVLAACQAKSTPTQVPTLAAAPTQTSAPVATTSALQEPTIMVASNPTLGNILVDGKGMTLYLFTTDAANKSNCDAKCLAFWPPLLTQGHPIAGTGVDASLLGSTQLADGRMIVTYNQAPLYYFAKDTAAGDIKGENVGSVWFAVSPQGMKVAGPTAAPTSTPGAAAFQEPTISVEDNPTLGKILDDGSGHTLYAFTKDAPNHSNCAGKCLAAWPPLLTQGKPVAGPGVDGSLLSTATLTDGRQIVTYNKMPLYYFAKDANAGDTTGEGIGSVWFVVNPQGMDVQPAAAAPTATPASAAFQEPTINVAMDAKLGNILVGSNGMTLYIFTNDTADKSNCDAKCLAAWPPLVTQGHPVAGMGVDASLLGSTTLADGRMIVTYNHMPLYYWFKDTKAGDTTGQGVGNVWYVISPAGKIIGQ